MAPAPSRPVITPEMAVYQQSGSTPIPSKGLAVTTINNTHDLLFTSRLHTGPSNPEYRTFEHQVCTFSQGSLEDHGQWRIAFDEVARAKPLLTSQAKFSMDNKLQSGAAKDLFWSAARRVEEVGLEAEEQQFQAALETMNIAFIH